MNKVFLIDGASGTGKSDLINFAKEHLSNYDIKIIKKNTTRPRRSKEEAPEIGEELGFYTLEEFQMRGYDNKCNYYTYKYGGHQYSFSKAELLSSAKTREYTFVIVRDKKLIANIQKDLANTAITLYIYLYTDEELVRKRLIAEGFSEEDIERRIERNKAAWRDYVSTPDDEVIVIINTSNRADFQRKIELLVEKYSNENENRGILFLEPSIKVSLPDSLIGYKERMLRALENNSYQKNVFLMMKFRESNEECYQSIKFCLEASGYNCVRADLPEWNLTGETHNYMAVSICCKYGIALFDEPEIFEKNGERVRIDYSPNVALEMGLMQILNKDILVLIHKSLSSVPFDLVKDLYVTYRGLDLISKIQKWLKKINLN